MVDHMLKQNKIERKKWLEDQKPQEARQKEVYEEDQFVKRMQSIKIKEDKKGKDWVQQRMSFMALA